MEHDSVEALYAQVFRDNRAIKLLVDPINGAIVDANEAAAQFYGYSIAELRRMKIADINVLPANELRAALAEASTSERERFQFPHRLASGELRRVEVFSGPVVLGGRTLLFSIIQDITERLRVQDELLRSEARFRSVVENLPTGVVVHRDGRILYANEAAAAIVGWELEALIGTTLLEHVDPEARTGVARRIRMISMERRIAPLQRTKLRRRDGSSVETEVRGAPIEFDGQAAVMALVVDTSERDRLEAQLRSAQRMEAVGRLASGVTHDFNNLLSVILNVARMMSKRLEHDDPLQEYVTHIHAASTRAADLTRQLLLFARGAEPAHTAVDVRQVIGDLVPLLRGSLGSVVKLEVVGQEDGCIVNVARVHLEQVFVNLAVNARDAMPHGGTLTFETALVAGSRSVRIIVRDDGTGMPPDVAAHVFEPFFTTKAPGIGTGLGLAITYGVVQRAGGSIELQSSPGAGTTFTIDLPVARPIVTPRAFSRIGDETILVVDHEAEVRSRLVDLLTQYGYRVLDAADADEAEFAIASGEVDLLLTDVVLPRTTGFELATRLRAAHPELRVLYMSRYAGDAVVGPSDVIIRPFDNDVLLDRVRASLGTSVIE